MPNFPKVAIVYLSYHCEPFLERAISAWKEMDYPKDRLAIVVVDNPHPNYGSSRQIIIDKLLPLSNRELPNVFFLPQENNLGFSAGHNIGIKWAIDNGFDYVYLHNLDGYITRTTIGEAVAAMIADSTIGVVQSLIMLHPQMDLINTSGNKFHYLGFGYCGDYRQSIANRNFTKQDIYYASGAAMLVRVDLVQQHGLLDTDFFAYHEDLEYSLRLRALGYRIILAPQSVFYHEYEFGRNPAKYYLMERNRIGLLLMYFKWRTLLLLLPMHIGVGCAELLVSIKNGWFGSWLKANAYWLNYKNWRLWLSKRACVRKIIRVTDSDLLKNAADKIEFDDKSVSGPLMDFGNWVVSGYWKLIRPIIKW